MRYISFAIVVFLFAGATKIKGHYTSWNWNENIWNSWKTVFLSFGSGNDIKGRLLTPEEGCGLTKVRNTRIIGGSEAPAGKYIKFWRLK